jgi:hypothetical protein
MDEESCDEARLCAPGFGGSEGFAERRIVVGGGCGVVSEGPVVVRELVLNPAEGDWLAVTQKTKQVLAAVGTLFLLLSVVQNWFEVLLYGVVISLSYGAFWLIGHLFWTLLLLIARLSFQLATTAIQPPTSNFVFRPFMNPEGCDALLGDLEERYKHLRRKLGLFRADFWYLKETMLSVGPVIWAATGATVKKLSGLAALVELYRRIRS